MKRFWLCAASLCAIAAAGMWAMGKKDLPAGELFVYSVVNEEETRQLTELFTARTGIAVRYFRAATGEIISRVKAEKNAPQADIVLGGAESQHISLALDGALAQYKSGALAGIPPAIGTSPTYARDNSWTGFCVLTLGIGINEARFRQKFPGKSFPATWDDLADPAYKGELVFTDPVKSSTGYLFLQSQLQARGTEAGWEYFKKLTPLAAQLPASGGAPPQLVGRGEYAICVAYVHALQLYAVQGFPVKIIVPPKTAGEVDAVSIIKNGPNAKSKTAEKFIDFMLSVEAQELFASLSHTIPVNPKAAQSAGAVSVDKIDLLDYDSQKAGAERDAALLRWQKEVL
jgi:iron(III) transport system substrate-binding protein